MKSPNELLSLFKFMSVAFCVITTIQVCFATILLYLGVAFGVGVLTLTRFLLIAFFTTLPSLILLFGTPRSRLWHRIQLFLHFFLTGAVCIFFAISFNFITFVSPVIIVLVYSIVYIFFMSFQEIHLRRLALRLNKRIDELHREKPLEKASLPMKLSSEHKALFKLMIVLFCAVTTTQVFVTMIALRFDIEIALGIISLTRFLVIAFATTLPALIFLVDVHRSHFWHRVQFVIHFLLTGAIFYLLAIHFNFLIHINAVVLGVLYIALYAIVMALQEVFSRRLAAELNERITAFHHAENASYRHED